MKLDLIRKCFRVCIISGEPVLIWGDPGVGKTRMIEAEVELLSEWLRKSGHAKGAKLITLITSIREPADFNGLPVIVQYEGGMTLKGTPHAVLMAPALWARQALEWANDNYWVVVFFDELSNAPPAVQAAGLRGIQDGWWGDIQLPGSHVKYAAAANPPEKAASGWELSPPMANRWTHLEWVNDKEAWVEGMVAGWPGEHAISQAERQNRILVASFIRLRPEYLHKMPENEALRGKAWPSNRTWTKAAMLITVGEQQAIPQDAINLLIAGCVGDGPAQEFLAWRRALDLPDPEDLLADPSKFKMPKRGDQQFAVLAAVASAVVGKMSKTRWKAGWEIFAIAAEDGAPDVAAIAVKTLASARKDDYPVPTAQLKKFIPILKAAGY